MLNYPSPWIILPVVTVAVIVLLAIAVAVVLAVWILCKAVKEEFAGENLLEKRQGRHKDSK